MGERRQVGALGRAYRSLVRRLGYVWGPRLASAVRKRWVLLRNPQAEIRFGRYAYLGPGFSLHMPDGGTFIAGDLVEFRRGFRAELVGPQARVVIGSNCVFSYYALVQCTTSIEFGPRSGIGQSTIVVDGNHRFRDLTQPTLEQGYNYRPIKIGEDAAVMSKCTIIADVGRRAIIGANSVVTKPIPDFSLAAGVPASVIEHFGPGERETLAERRT